ncbi:MAG: acylneuraminate cytidylyltransferase family protein [Acidobacteriota bacterium]
MSRDYDVEVMALIPARGGSKGIHRKNLSLVGGLPLVAHSVLHALGCPKITRTIVSTEDSEIRDAALRAGAEVPFCRPDALAEDHVLDFDVFAHALDWLISNEGYRPDIIVHLRPTSPIRRAAWIAESIDLLVSHPNADSVRSVSPVQQHPYRMFRKNDEGFLEPLLTVETPKPYELRRQDLPNIYYYNCVIDVTRHTTIQVKRSMAGDRILAYMMSPDDVVDIDSARDLRQAQVALPEPR